MKSILFICTGNVFRSVTAEYALKHALGSKAEYRVASAGTAPVIQGLAPFVRRRLLERGIDPSGHVQQGLTQELLQQTDMAVAMGLDHRDYIKRKFSREVPLFNQICFDRTDPVLDVWEAVPDWEHNEAAKQAYALAVVDHICDAMPYFVRKLVATDGRRTARR